MNVLVLGLALSGKSAIRFLLKKNCCLFAFDDNLHNLKLEKDIQNKIAFLTHPEELKKIDLVVLSPGINPKHRFIQQAKKYRVPIIGESELALRHLSNFCIGITGTNGKTTLCALVAHVLNQEGKKAVCLGNMGNPLTRYAENALEEEILVVELSSFQLETMRTKCFDLAAILNITPDHLDRYKDFQEYAKTKLHIQSCLKKQGSLIVSKQVERDFSAFLKPPYSVFLSSVDLSSRFLVPKQTLFMAYTLCRKLGIEEDKFIEALKTFCPLEHRMEFVAKINEVVYINDSKATNLFSVVQAVQMLDQKILLIAGGFDKNVDFLLWKKCFSNKVKKIFAIGQVAKKIQDDLRSEFDVEIANELQKALNKAKKYAKKGDVVLFSPGCSSYDQFKNFEERGKTFKQSVLKMAQQKR